MSDLTSKTNLPPSGRASLMLPASILIAPSERLAQLTWNSRARARLNRPPSKAVNVTTSAIGPVTS